MSITGSGAHREAIRTTLQRLAGSEADAMAYANATLQTWLQMATRLEPVIGARGVDALFSRALHLASNEFVWLANAEGRGNSALSLAGIKTCFATQDKAVAREAGCALLATFTDLLASLIGEPLTERLLGAVLAPAPTQPAQETRI